MHAKREEGLWEWCIASRRTVFYPSQEQHCQEIGLVLTIELVNAEREEKKGEIALCGSMGVVLSSWRKYER